MEKRLTGIVIKTVDYKESDRLVTLLTKEEGKALIKLRGVRKAKSKLNFASFPFFMGVYILTETKGGYVVTGVDPINRYDYSSLDLNTYYLRSLMCEVADKLSEEGYTDTELFDYTASILNSVGKDSSIIKSAIDIIIGALDIAGHGLNREYPNDANGFSYDEGGLINIGKTVGMRLTDGVVQAIKNILSGADAEEKYLPNILSLINSYFSAKTTKKLQSVGQILQMQDVIE